MALIKITAQWAEDATWPSPTLQVGATSSRGNDLPCA